MGVRLRQLVPKPWRRWLVRKSRSPRVGGIDLGPLRRLSPVSRGYGGDRGLPIDRHYIETFLTCHAEEIRGAVLEVGADAYTRRFGGARVVRSAIVDVDPDNARADYVTDLAVGGALPDEAFDCVICTQTVQLIYEVGAAFATLYRILRPAGTLLLTVPGITKVDRESAGKRGDFWRFTTQSVRRLLLDTGFPEAGVDVRCHGNVLASACFLYGLAAEELTPEELDHEDENYPMLITACAQRAGTPE